MVRVGQEYYPRNAATLAQGDVPLRQWEGLRYERLQTSLAGSTSCCLPGRFRSALATNRSSRCVHTYASLLIDSGPNVVFSSRLSGHAALWS